MWSRLSTVKTSLLFCNRVYVPQFRLAAGRRDAAKYLLEVVTDPNAPIRERVRASIALLDRSVYATSDPSHEPPRRSELDDLINS